MLSHRDRSDKAMSDAAHEGFPARIEALLEDVFFREAHWHSAYEVAVQRLAQAIKLGALKAGARLPPERELVERLGVSRTTLREGIRALQQQGFLKTSRGRSGGTFVVQPRSGQPTRADIQRIAKEMGPLIPELLDMRAAVEPKAAELAARRASDEAIGNLRWLAERAHRVRPADLRQADSTLHIAVAHTARSARILDLVLEEQMRLHELLAYLSLAPKLREHQGHSGLQHDRIVETIADRDAAAAYEAMQDHIEATNAIIVELLDLDLDLEAVPTG
jgi:GntR family transcriptional regulator, transcriptional repressor for pyruvate dehydrogenase complex